MDFPYWRKRLEDNQARAMPLPGESSLTGETRLAVAQLLHQYAEGEAAEHAIADALLAGAHDEDDRAALAVLLEDERRHGESLARAALILDGKPSSPRPDIHQLLWIGKRLSFTDILIGFHLMELCVATAYRVLRAAHRHDPLLRALLDPILRDEVIHRAFHEQRLRERIAVAGRLGRWRMRLVHVAARRLLVTSDRSVAPDEIYVRAMGVHFASFKATLEREYTRVYSGPLAVLRTG